MVCWSPSVDCTAVCSFTPASALNNAGVPSFIAMNGDASRAGDGICDPRCINPLIAYLRHPLRAMAAWLIASPMLHPLYLPGSPPIPTRKRPGRQRWTRTWSSERIVQPLNGEGHDPGIGICDRKRPETVLSRRTTTHGRILPSTMPSGRGKKIMISFLRLADQGGCSGSAWQCPCIPNDCSWRVLSERSPVWRLVPRQGLMASPSHRRPEMMHHGSSFASRSTAADSPSIHHGSRSGCRPGKK